MILKGLNQSKCQLFDEHTQQKYQGSTQYIGDKNTVTCQKFKCNFIFHSAGISSVF